MHGAVVSRQLPMKQLRVTRNRDDFQSRTMVDSMACKMYRYGCGSTRELKFMRRKKMAFAQIEAVLATIYQCGLEMREANIVVPAGREQYYRR